jgi:hypothetical protein
MLLLPMMLQLLLPVPLLLLLPAAAAATAAAAAAAVQEGLLRSSLLHWCTSRALAQSCTQTQRRLAAVALQGRWGRTQRSVS